MTPMSEIEYNRYMEPLRGVIVAKLGQMLDGGIPRDNTYFYESLLVAPQIMTWERFEEFVANARDEFVRAAGTSDIFRLLSNDERANLPRETWLAAINDGAFDCILMHSFPDPIARDTELAVAFISRAATLIEIHHVPEGLFRDPRFATGFVERLPQLSAWRYRILPGFAKTLALALYAVDTCHKSYVTDVFIDSPREITHVPILWEKALMRGLLLCQLPPDAYDHRPTVLRAASMQGYYTLKYANLSFLEDEEILTAAVICTPKAVKYIPDDPSFDPIFEIACAENPTAYQYGNDRQRRNPTVAQRVVERDGSMVQYFPGKKPADILVLAASNSPASLTGAEKRKVVCSASRAMESFCGMTQFMAGARRSTSLCPELIQHILGYAGWKSHWVACARRALSNCALVEEARLAASAEKRGGNRKRRLNPLLDPLN